MILKFDESMPYCWWFRNPKANHLECNKPLVNNEIKLPTSTRELSSKVILSWTNSDPNHKPIFLGSISMGLNTICTYMIMRSVMRLKTHTQPVKWQVGSWYRPSGTINCIKSKTAFSFGLFHWKFRTCFLFFCGELTIIIWTDSNAHICSGLGWLGQQKWNQNRGESNDINILRFQEISNRTQWMDP